MANFCSRLSLRLANANIINRFYLCSVIVRLKTKKRKNVEAIKSFVLFAIAIECAQAVKIDSDMH